MTKDESLRIAKKDNKYYVESVVKGKVVSVIGPLSKDEALTVKSMDMRKRRRYRKKAMVQKAKNKPCHDCQRQLEPSQMTFDHVKGPKCFDLADGPKKSWTAITKELEKCEIVCRSCHNVREFQRGRVCRLTSVEDLATLLSMTLTG